MVCLSAIRSTNAERQFVWGLRYIDDLVLRDRDANSSSGDGLEGRLYCLQDPNWNVVAIADEDGAIVERYRFDAYGSPTFQDTVFGARGSSDYDWETLYAGYRYDAEAKWYHVRHRILLPYLGRWNRRDPIGYDAGDENLYRYVENRPTSETDPTGYQAVQSGTDEAVEAIKAQTLTACTNHYNKTLRFDKRVSKCYGAILNRVRQLEAAGKKGLARKCKSLKFECVCCADRKIDPRVAGAYDPNTHTVLMCSENAYMRGGNDYFGGRQLCHEMIHALQGPSCATNAWPPSCVNSLAKEVQAYFCTRQCTGARQCLSSAISSARLGGSCGANEPTSEQHRSVLRWAISMIRQGNMCRYGIEPDMF